MPLATSNEGFSISSFVGAKTLVDRFHLPHSLCHDALILKHLLILRLHSGFQLLDFLAARVELSLLVFDSLFLARLSGVAVIFGVFAGLVMAIDELLILALQRGDPVGQLRIAAALTIEFGAQLSERPGRGAKRRVDGRRRFAGGNFGHQLAGLADDGRVPFLLQFADFGRGKPDEFLERLHVGLGQTQFAFDLGFVRLVGG